MTLFRIALILVSLFGYQAFAQDNESVAQPQLSIQQSKYVDFKGSNVSISNETTVFEGKFIVLGEGVYGHFDMVAFDDSGKVLQKAMSEDRAWRRDQGSKLKTLTLSVNEAYPSKVDVSFHEMRVNSDIGACKQ